MGKKRWISTELPIFISVLALVISGYSVMITKESQEFETTQTLTIKSFELISVLENFKDLVSEEYRVLSELKLVHALHADEINDSDLDTDFLEWRLNRNREDRKQAIDLHGAFGENMLEHIDDIDIGILEANIGLYNLKSDLKKKWIADDRQTLSKLGVQTGMDEAAIKEILDQ